MTTSSLIWPNCKCGHIAQDHNTVREGFLPHYGCDRLGCDCIDYTFPANTPQELKDGLEAQRAAVLATLGTKK